MIKLRADLHVHTYYSDGLLSPAEVVLRTVQAGVNVLAVTDHDCVAAFDETFALCTESGVKCVSGIEVSAYEGDVKIHMLGYNFNREHPQFKEFIKQLYDGSFRRTEDILFKLNKNGVALSMDDVLSQRKSPLSPIHSMYIARAAALKGYMNNAFSFYARYLSAGKCGFSSVCRPAPETAAEVINACGGFASLAHPGRIAVGKERLLSLIKKLKDYGLCGIEGVYSTHTVTETAYYKETAKAFNLVVTGGSDTHSCDGKKQIGTPAFFVDEALAEKLGI